MMMIRQGQKSSARIFNKLYVVICLVVLVIDERQDICIVIGCELICTMFHSVLLAIIVESRK
jgi:uncharacterized membrane protein